MERIVCGARVAALLMASSVVAGCGGGRSDAAPLCSDVDALSVSIDAVANVELSRAGLGELKTDLTQVKSDLTTVGAAAEQQYAQEINAVDQAYATLSSDLSDAVSAPSASTIATVGSDVHALGASLSALQTAVKNTC